MARILLVIVLAFPITLSAQAPGRGDGKYIVTFRAGTSRDARAAVVGRAGAALRFNYSIVDAVAIRIPNANALAALRRESSIVGIVPDLPVQAFQSSEGIVANAKPGPGGGGGTTGQVIPEGVKRVGTAVSGSDGLGVGVAILDTGIDLVNADLQANIHPDTFFSPSVGTSCQDNNGHGTHVAGIVAAADNTIGTVGVAPKATLYCVKVLDSAGNGSDSDVIAGLEWAATRAAIRVVNMSLGRDASTNPADDAPMRAAVQSLYNLGVTVVVSAGNEATKQVQNMVPAGFPEVISVASTTAIGGTNSCRRLSGVIKADTASYFTTDGAATTVSAPGEDREDVNNGCFISSVGILSTKLGGGTTRMSGTSMASPLVAGIAARRLQQHGWTPDALRTEIQNTAQRKGTAPLDSPTTTYTFDGVREGIAVAPPAAP